MHTHYIHTFELIGVQKSSKKQHLKQELDDILLRKRGITVRKTIDSIIATYCIENQISLLHSDKDFMPFAQHLGLHLLPTQDM